MKNLDNLLERANKAIEQLGLEGLFTACYREGNDWCQVEVEADLDGIYLGSLNCLDDDDSEEEITKQIKAWFDGKVKPDLISYKEQIEKYI
jgi:hypothetical protein